MMVNSKPVALDEIRESAREMLVAGKTDDALDYLLSALGSVLRKNSELELLLAKLRREHSGKRSEKIDPAQLSLLFDELAHQDESVEPEAEAETDRKLSQEIEGARRDEQDARGEKKKAKRGEVRTRNVQRRVHERKVAPEERVCQECGREKRALGSDVSRVLEFVPARFVEHVFELEKLACSTCKDGVTTAPGPGKVLDRSIAGASLLAQVVVSKYADHCPLHRQRRIYKRGGTLLSVSTLSDWIAGVATRVEPLVERLAERVLQAHVVGTDATGLKALDPDSSENIQRGTVWCYVGDDKDVVFRYTPTGEGETGPWSFLANRKGYIQADAASVFDRLFNGEVASATELGCWAHAARRFKALLDTDCRAAYPVRLIARLFRIETLADVKHLDFEGRAALRQERSGETLDKLKRWLLATQANEPPKSAMASAIGYVLNQWDALIRFVEDGRLHLDNNIVEQQLRDVALGRKNFLFAGSHEAARRAASLYSLMRTCAQHGVPPLPYLTDVLQKLAQDWPDSRLEELLPDRWLRLHGESYKHPSAVW